MDNEADPFDYIRAIMAAYMNGGACFRVYVALSAINDYLQTENRGDGLDNNGMAVASIIEAVMMAVERDGSMTDMTYISDKSAPAEHGPLDEEEIKRFIDQIGGTPDAEKDEDD